MRVNCVHGYYTCVACMAYDKLHDIYVCSMPQETMVHATCSSIIVMSCYHLCPCNYERLKADRVLACMRRGFINLNESILLQLYKSMVQPILEYGNVIWGLHYVLDQCKLEGAQRCATKLVPSLRDESYID